MALNLSLDDTYERLKQSFTTSCLKLELNLFKQQQQQHQYSSVHIFVKQKAHNEMSTQLTYVVSILYGMGNTGS